MFKIKKLNLATGKVVKVPLQSSDFMRWLKKQDVDPVDAVCVVDHSFNKTKLPEAQEKLEGILRESLELDNIVDKLLFAGSSQMRKAWSTFVRQDLVEKFRSWWNCGINVRKNIVANKSLVYDALAMSSSVLWEEGTSLPPINIDNVAIVDDAEVEIEGIFDVVTNTVTRMLKKVVNKISDGIAVGVVDDEKMDAATRSAIRLLPFTFRGPGFKGLIVWVLKSDLIAFCEERGCGFVLKDHWGNERDVRTLQLIAHTSVFKWTKCCDDWDTYVKGFKANGHAFSVCVKDHNNSSDLPYQQFQTLLCDEQDTSLLTTRSVEMLSAFEDLTQAPRLLPRAIGQVARIYPNLMNDTFVSEEMKVTYKSKRQKLAGGRIPDACHYRFAAPDIVAVLENIFGLEVKGAIPAKHIVCNALKPGQVVDITRCPHLDNAHCLRRNIVPSGTEARLFNGTTVFFSIHDATMNALQMDYDGDHVAVCENEDIIRMARKAIRKLGNVPLYYEAKGTKPGDVTDEQIVQLLLNIEPAPVGLYANSLTKLWADYKPHKNKDIAFLTEGANTCIDAAKYITGNASSMESTASAQSIAKYRKVEKPMFLAYAKTSAMDPQAFAEFAATCKVYDSCVENYSQGILRYTEPELNVQDLEGLTFDWHVLTSGKACRAAIEGLVTTTSDFVDGKEGLFNRLAYRKSECMAEARESTNNSVIIAQYDCEMNDLIRKTVFAYGADRGFDSATVIDSLIMIIHVRENRAPGVTRQLKRVLWSAFGSEILANVRFNLKNGIVPGGEEAQDEFVETDYVYADEECCIEDFVGLE